ncbi:uncharacterized protein C18orf63-like [Montipora foliosa]|uniref:uncharacterized protein C18orf63-like n=1 Tax=Montipora foliosa TaxID=591990 RepID=UPI0035F1899E
MRSQDGYLGLYFAHLPNLDELTAVKASIQKRKNDKLNAIQPMCCRELIFTEPNVLVSPILEEKNQFFLVAQGTVFQSSKFKELLQKLNIQNTESVDLTRSLFQFCLSFTLKQKLAPLWNKAGEFLVQGRDFMLESSKLNAVTLELNISDKICLGLQAYSLKLQPCKPEHFTASTSALERFYTSKEAVIGDAAISDDLCFVLPSLKKGRILSITHEVPDDSPFTSYEDLRKHWKQMYGYRLPQEENVFYNVHFYYIKGKIFTYPGSCIRSSDVLVSARCDHALIFSSFLRDLSSRMSCVCGTPLALTSSPLYPISKLQQATHANYSNLTRTAPHRNHCIPFTIQRSHGSESLMRANSSPRSPVASLVSSQIVSSCVQTVPEAENMPLVNQLGRTCLTSASNINQAQTTPFGIPSAKSHFVPCFVSKTVTSSVDWETNRAAVCDINRPAPDTRIVPTFSNTVPKKERRNKTVNALETTPKAPPPLSSVRILEDSPQMKSSTVSTYSSFVGFSPRIAGTNQGHNLSRQESINGITSTMMRQQVIYQGVRNGFRDISSNLSPEWTKKNDPSKNPTNVSPLGQVAISSTQVTKCLPDSRPGLVVTRAGSASQSVRNEVASSTSTTIQEPRRNAVIQQQRQAGLGIFLNKGVCGISRSVLATDISEHNLRDQNVGIGQSRPETQAIAEQSRKRQVLATDLPHGEPCQRKPRQRSRIQEGVDVRGMATKDQLRKINAVTLADWLKQRGIAVKSKDKKSDLESKVMQYIAMVPRNEP